LHNNERFVRHSRKLR